jgi:hydroxymethylpyrimidine/phosphomethylpyrimidine kinase
VTLELDLQATPPHDVTAVALTIAGSDSGGGAGIQADLKAFANLGVHGASAITAITAQNTVEVSAVHLIPPEVVLAQIRAVVSDLGVDAVKVGMLGGERLIAAVAQALDELPRAVPIVVDPVMVAESGARLLPGEAQAALIGEILPRAAVLTPNLPEARVLLGLPEGAAESDLEIEQMARGILAMGPRAVVLTGGHRASASDLLIDSTHEEQAIWIEGPRHPDGAAHGSGCTHSSTLAAALARGFDLERAARIARKVAAAAVAAGLRDLGAGAGPVDVLDIAKRRASAAEADPGLS